MYVQNTLCNFVLDTYAYKHTHVHTFVRACTHVPAPAKAARRMLLAPPREPDALRVFSIEMWRIRLLVAQARNDSIEGTLLDVLLPACVHVCMCVCV
jgi:hypothetical protein